MSGRSDCCKQMHIWFKQRLFIHRKQTIVTGNTKAICWGKCTFQSYSEVKSTLTLSLPQTVQLPGWKVLEHACKQYISRPAALLLSILCVLKKILARGNAKKKAKQHQNKTKTETNKKSHLYWSFSRATMAANRLTIGAVNRLTIGASPGCDLWLL